MPGHLATHPAYVEGCFACKVLTVSTNLSPTTREIDGRDRALSADLAAYKRLRRDGLQPPRIDGSAAAEGRVESQYDFHLGRYVPKGEMSRVREAMSISKELGYVTEAGR